MDKVEATLEMDADEPTPPPHPVPQEARPVEVARPIESTPPATVAVEPLMRADDALTDAGLQQLVVAPDFVVKHAADERRRRRASRSWSSAASLQSAPSLRSTSARPSRAVSRTSCRRPSAGCFPIRRRR